jgi:hypothetical protein
VLETLDEHQIAGRKVRGVFGERRFDGAAQLAHQYPARAGSEQHLGGTRLAVTKGVLARPIDIEIVMRVLEYRNTQAAGSKARQQLLQQCRLAGTGVAGDTEQSHRQFPA